MADLRRNDAVDGVGPHGIFGIGAGGSRNEQAANLAERGTE
jgi:hypothetical protein